MDEIQQIGKFKVISKLGQGSFGLVLKGYDPDIRRDVAIKICTVEDVGLRKRFAREAQISGNLRHKNIVTVFAADTTDDDIPYLVQEFLDGEDVRDLIRRREPLPSNEKVDYLLQVARGLAHAHSHGVIHRDIKPANVRRLSDGTVKIMDFGIAKLASAETQLTQKGVTMGTASYLPPEQVRGGDLDHRADIFSFGVLAYELLTYERPFQGNTLSALVYQILYKVPVPMNAIWPECPEVLSDLVAKCLEKKPDDRFATMEEVIPQLERISQEIEAGKWPALRGVSTVQAFLSDVAEDTSVMSQTEVARTAKAVEGEEVATLPADVATLPASSPAAESLAESALAESASAESAAARKMSLETAPTQILAMPEVPKAPASRAEAPVAGSEVSELATAPLSQQELADRAQQISNLIAQGKLEDAREHLEKTMTERLDASPSAEDTLMPQPPPASPATVTVPTASIPLSRAGTEAARKAGRPRPGSGKPAEADTGTGNAYGTAFFSWGLWQRWAAVAAAALVVIVVAWLLLGRGGEAPEGLDEEPVATTKPVPEEMPGSTAASGWVTVAARPWARITEITDADGFLKELPDDPHTPLRLELAPGTYQLQLEYHPDGREGGLSSCEIVVVEGESTECRVEFDLPTVTDYFKESGWWS